MNCLGTFFSDTAPLTPGSWLASISRNITAVFVQIRRVVNSATFHEAYLSHAVALGKGDVSEMVVRVAVSTVTQTFHRAFNKSRRWDRAAMQQAA